MVRPWVPESTPHLQTYHTVTARRHILFESLVHKGKSSKRRNYIVCGVVLPPEVIGNRVRSAVFQKGVAFRQYPLQAHHQTTLELKKSGLLQERLLCS